MHSLVHRGRTKRNLPNAFAGHPSQLYDLFARRLLRVVYRRVAADIAAVAPQGASVLDVGTGPGVLLVELAAGRPDLQLAGVDLSADMITAAQRNLTPFADRARAHVGDVANLPFDDQSFDLIVSSISAHHWDDPDAAVPELARVLRPGGRVRIYDFPFAPFDQLARAAAASNVLNGQTPERSRIRTGIPFLPYIRFVMSA